MPERKQILVLAVTALDTDLLHQAADKLALEMILGCSDDTGTLRLNFTTRDSALHIVEYVQQNPVVAIIPVGDLPTPSAARASSMIGLPFHPPKSADVCANKELLCRKLGAAGISFSNDVSTTFECVMTSGKLRVLATDHSAPPALLSDLQKNAPALLRNIISALGLKHGPVRVELSSELAVANVSLCYLPTVITGALRFRIPLVDDDISYGEVIIRNALDLDISRIHVDRK
jgi:hypothetical protein